MGFRVLLVAVFDREAEEIRAEYGVRETGQTTPIAEHPVSAAHLPSGAYLLYINDDILPEDNLMERLSRGGRLLCCYANETVMNSFAAEWFDGDMKWSIYHDANQGLAHCETTGELPPQYSQIRSGLIDEQPDADGADLMFDLAIEVFVASGGVYYDRDTPGVAHWNVLERVSH